MNILFFLTPKAVCSHVRAEDSVRQALERMEKTGYAALPILSKDGRYCGTLTEGDLLWTIKNKNLIEKHAMERVGIMDCPHRKDYKTVSVETKMEDLMVKAVEQNFVPVVDDRDMFIGIITRKAILQYCMENYLAKDKPEKADSSSMAWSYHI